MDAVYADPDLRADLESGKKIHALMATALFPDETYDSIIATKGTDDDKYDKGKRTVFAVGYGGDENTIHDRIGIPLEDAAEGFKRWTSRYKKWGEERQAIFDRFCSMRQPGGIGTAVEWHDPDPYVESLLGFRRYFTLENRVCKALFDLANKPPASWKQIQIKVVRRSERGVQTASGAVQSALFAAAFQIQAANMRAAGNHVIQSTGGQLTKGLQREIWDIQPPGIHTFIVLPFNCHDEVLTPTKQGHEQRVQDTATRYIESKRSVVPLLAIGWKTGLSSWVDK